MEIQAIILLYMLSVLVLCMLIMSFETFNIDTTKRLEQLGINSFYSVLILILGGLVIIPTLVILEIYYYTFFKEKDNGCS